MNSSWTVCTFRRRATLRKMHERMERDWDWLIGLGFLSFDEQLSLGSGAYRAGLLCICLLCSKVLRMKILQANQLHFSHFCKSTFGIIRVRWRWMKFDWDVDGDVWKKEGFLDVASAWLDSCVYFVFWTSWETNLPCFLYCLWKFLVLELLKQEEPRLQRFAYRKSQATSNHGKEGSFSIHNVSSRDLWILKRSYEHPLGVQNVFRSTIYRRPPYATAFHSSICTSRHPSTFPPFISKYVFVGISIPSLITTDPHSFHSCRKCLVPQTP